MRQGSSFMRLITRLTTTVFATALILAAPSAWPDDEHHHALSEQEIGSVHFSTSCGANVQQSFNHAVALLHSFQYEQARGAFSKIADADPRWGMAPGGSPVWHYHGLWSKGDMAAGRAALQKAQQTAWSNPATTAREKGYIDALAEVYGEDSRSKAAREQGYENKMAELQGEKP